MAHAFFEGGETNMVVNKCKTLDIVAVTAQDSFSPAFGEVPNVDRVLIHYEPQSKTQLRYAVALSSHREEISEHLGESPYFALLTCPPKSSPV